MSVLLPEPDGPHTTTTSPLAMEVVQSVSTWKLPYHLLTFLMSITCRSCGSPGRSGAPGLGVSSVKGQRMMAILACNRLTSMLRLKQMTKYTSAASR